MVFVNKGTWFAHIKKRVNVNRFPIFPTIIGRLKNHKKDMPLLHIITNCPGPLYFNEKAFVVSLKNILLESDLMINSTNEFIQRVDSIQLLNDYLVTSLDIGSSYPTIET